MKSISSNLRLSRQKLELFYSIFLLLIIPGLIVVNTLLVSRSVKDNFDTELRRKADVANVVFGNAAEQNLDEPEIIQTTLENIIIAEDDLANIFVAVPASNGQFSVIAAADSELVGQDITSLQLQVVNDRRKSVAQLVNRSDDTAKRSWNVVTPIISDNELTAVTSIDVSIADAEGAISATLTRSFVILFVTVFIVALLLANHFRFVEYAQLFQKVKEADQLKTDFLSVATHELRAPMSIIKGQISNVIDGDLGDISDGAKDQLNQTIQQTDRLNSLVEDLLNVSRIEQGRLKIETVDFVPGDTIEVLVEQYRSKADQKGLEINYEGLDTQVKLRADIGRFAEIMTNLIDNAVKYSNKGSITIRHELKDKSIITRVKDTGIGMSAKERERLFSRFYRVKNERTKSIPGTGLGLWIIKQYIEKMGGKISVDSLEGEGTEFIVELPRSPVN
ncbi:MAG: HAMP domain-containing sensor histidine kinase [Candidatus Saccharimonadales bacterium]|nr:HAMP domain-containing sensor histidine kinase [Candidatus Saccharimonadales bacterium]